MAEKSLVIACALMSLLNDACPSCPYRGHQLLGITTTHKGSSDTTHLGTGVSPRNESHNRVTILGYKRSSSNSSEQPAGWTNSKRFGTNSNTSSSGRPMNKVNGLGFEMYPSTLVKGKTKKMRDISYMGSWTRRPMRKMDTRNFRTVSFAWRPMKSSYSWNFGTTSLNGWPMDKRHAWSIGSNFTASWTGQSIRKSDTSSLETDSDTSWTWRPMRKRDNWSFGTKSLTRRTRTKRNAVGFGTNSAAFENGQINKLVFNATNPEFKINESFYLEIFEVGELLNAMNIEWFSPVEYTQSHCPCSNNCFYAPEEMSAYANETSETASNCCILCDCSDECYASGTCCSEKIGGPEYFANGMPATKNNEICTLPVVAHSTSEYEARLVNEGHNSYLIVAICDEEYSGEAEMKCLHPNVSSMIEMTPVFSDQTKLSYGNIYCAECNFADVNRVQEWSPHLHCKNETYFGLFANYLPLTRESALNDVYNFETCALYWIPLQLENKRCLPRNVHLSQCKGTIEGVNADILRDACKETNSPIRINSIEYNNVFCYACTLQQMHDTINFYSFDTDTSTGFNALLNIHQTRAHESGVVNMNRPDAKGCGPGYLFSKILIACLRISCPPGGVLVGDVCEPYISNIDGLSLDFRLQISSPLPKNSGDIITETDILLFATGIMGTKTSCSEMIKSSIYGGKIYFTIQIVTLSTKDQTLEETYAFVKSRIQATLNSEKTVLDVQIIDDAYEELLDKRSNRYIYFANSNHGCPKAVAMSNEQFCETVALSTNQFNVTSNGDLEAGDMRFKPNDFFVTHAGSDDRQMAHVCTRNFISMEDTVDKTSYTSLSSPFAIIYVTRAIPLFSIALSRAFILVSVSV